MGVVNITPRKICIGRGLAGIKSAYLTTDFIYYWLKPFKTHFEEKATGTTFKSISSDNIKDLLFPLPPLSEQQRILDTVENIFSYLDNLETIIKGS